MQLVEQHVISQSDPRFVPIDAAAFKAKNLYNAANYLVRQAFIFERRYLGYAEIFHLSKHTEAYTALPRKVSNDILRQLDKNWRAFFAALEAWKEDPSKFVGRPKLPKYKDKTRGRFLAITSNKQGFVPRLVNGRPIKSTNQYYNKRRAALQEALGHAGTTARMERFTAKRTRRINHYLHAASKSIIALLVEEGIGTLVVGKNPGWKQEVKLGRVNNQHFVQLPHARFIAMLEYKAKRAGIRLALQEESYTSKASFLDGDPLPTYDPKQEDKHAFSGKRVKRGLYQARDGRTLNADVNGSYNILRKALPTAFANGIEAVAVRPVWLTFAWSVQPRALAAA